MNTGGTFEYLFVYGTLLTQHNTFGLYLAQNSRLAATGKIKGKLYDIGNYPGVVPDAAGGYVHGKIFEIDNDAAVLQKLDEYEGISAQDTPPFEYTRVLYPAETDNGIILCWVYLYNWPVDGFTQVVNGDWLTYKGIL